MTEQAMSYYDMFKETQAAYARLELRNEEVKRENRRLRTEFVELLEEAKDMRSYVPDYFAKKWKHDEALERAIAVAAELGQEDRDA